MINASLKNYKTREYKPENVENPLEWLCMDIAHNWVMKHPASRRMLRAAKENGYVIEVFYSVIKNAMENIKEKDAEQLEDMLNDGFISKYQIRAIMRGFDARSFVQDQGDTWNDTNFIASIGAWMINNRIEGNLAANA